MATCRRCGRVSEEIAEVLSLCAGCVRKAGNGCPAELGEIHAQAREKFGLAALPPFGPKGTQCRLCQNGHYRERSKTSETHTAAEAAGLKRVRIGNVHILR